MFNFVKSIKNGNLKKEKLMPKYPCTKCNESGDVDCPLCIARKLGKKHCKHCDGRGKVRCPICSGNGKVGHN